MLLWILTAVLLGLYGCLILFYGYHWKRLPLFVPQKAAAPNTYLSVVIAARNEERDLPLLLQKLQEQSYPKQLVEIIIVDDFSTDGTATVVAPFLSERVRIIQPHSEASSSSKKKAIEAGVTAAKGDLIVITDADCLPSARWLETVASFYTEKNPVFIAAPVKFLHDHSLLQIFQALDFMVLQGITAASTSANFHTMCNGANLAYTGQAFKEVNGFKGIDAVASGDDMLLMYKIWKQHPDQVLYLKSKEAVVTTQPMKSWRAFFNQRRRWASKTLHYDDHRITAVLGLVYLVNLLFPALVIAAFLNPSYWLLVLAYLLVKTVIEFPFVASVARFYGERSLLKYFPLFQPLHILYTVSVGFLSQLGKYEWKERQTK
jgi:cellulose synthase/poly-beta-1,6-N-acetylglucosamine synthase-like glycosyltransferase